MNTLFDLPESKSPRLLWMEKYQVTIHKSGYAEIVESEFGDWYPFTAINGPVSDANGNHLYPPRGEGLTEDEALANLAKTLGVKLWNEE